jgi:hypothetical protein
MRHQEDDSCADEDLEACDRSTLISMLEESKRKAEELLEDNYDLKYRNVVLSLELLELKSGWKR